MKIQHLVIGLMLASIGCLPGRASTTTLLNDDFSSAVVNTGSASVAAGVSSATQWYQNATDSTTISNGMISLAGNVGTSSSNGRMILAYFTPTGNLAVGSTVTLTYDFSLTGIGDGGGNALRVGLFYSANSRPTIGSTGLIGLGSATAGSSDTANAPYNAWQGYLLGFNHKSTGAADSTNGSRFFQRVVNSASGLEQSLTSPTFYVGMSQPSSYGAGFAVVAGTVYTATVSITRASATELDLSYSVAGQAVNFTQTLTVGASDVIQFDAVNFYLKQGTTASTKMADSWNIDNVKVELATGSVAVAPSITTQPVSQSVAVGGSAAFTVVATGTAPLSYQWKKDGADISGATSATLSLSNVQASDGATYSVVVSNGTGSATSADATLTVLVSPAITTQPVDQSVAVGGSATFTVVATGTAPLSYQWRKGGADISGVTSATLSLSNVQAADDSAYSVVVSNGAGSVTSADAVLTVLVPPSITTQPVGQSVAVGGSATFTVVATGTAPLNYQWKKGGVDLAGATSATLSLTNVQASDGATYSVVVSNGAGSVTSADATLAILVPPAITTQPLGQSVTVGGSVTFTAVASGSPAPTYQWRKDGADISGATASSLTLVGIGAGDAGSYTVVATNAAGTATSDPAVLVVNTPVSISTQPQSTSVLVGANVTFSVTAAGTAPLSYQWKKNNVALNGETASTLTLTSVQLTDSGDYTVVVTNPAGAVTSDIATLEVSATAIAPSITTQPASQTANVGGTVTFTVSATGTQPITYQWRKNGATIAGATSATYVLNSITATDAGTYTVEITNPGGTVTSAGATLTVLVPPSITTQPTDKSVAVGSSAAFTVAATGSAPLSYQWRKGGADISGATAATLSLSNVQVSDGAIYSVVVSNGAGSVTSENATLTVLAPPAIIVQPTSQSIALGGSVTFTVSATGASPLTYQWSKDGTPIGGATAATYTLSSITADDAGTYTVEVANVSGTVTSAGAVLTVTNAYLTNVSVRVSMSQGQTPIIGFVVNGSKPILVRVGGPVLNQYGLSGLPDPALKLVTLSGTVVATNDNWSASLTELFATLGATPFDAGSKDAALLATITGPQTVHATGSGSGVVLVEAYDAGPANGPKLVNVSARYQVGTGDNILIAGFVIGGTGKKQMLIRGVGPGIAKQGVAGVLADPQIAVYDQNTLVASNDNWSPELAATFSRLGAFPLDASSKDAALVIELDAGKPYTVHVSGVGNTTGEALIEVYDANP